MERIVQTKHPETRKVFSSNLNLVIGDIVLIADLMTKLNYPKIGRISEVEKDSMGVERFSTVNNKKTKKVPSSVKRPAQSLCVVMKKDELEDVVNPVVRRRKK